ncbi:aspartic peptidase domain-containing protein, partial [Pilaira anomala]
MHLNSLLFSTLLLYTTCIHSYVIPKHDFITLPLLKRLPSSSIIEKRAATSEQSKLYNADNVEYLTKLYIGTPPQEFLVSIDTGSADTWVPSSECPSSQCPYKRFDQEKSSTYQPLNISFAINYAQGSVHGSYAKEKMNLLGPESTNNITSPEQTIGLSHSAKEIISGGMEMTSNGILGLAFPALAANSDTLEAYKPFLFELAAKKIISQPVFSISLNEKEGWQSELTIGGINRDKFTGEIRYLPVVKNVNPKTAELDYTFWSVELKGIQIDQKNNLKVNQKVTLDTGTTYSYLSKELVDQIVQDVTQQKPTV